MRDPCQSRKAWSLQFNGRTPPFAGQPVRGFSALIEDGRRGRYLALSDNGYGAKANSADFLLRAHRLQPDFRTGTVRLLGSLTFTDPRGLAGQPLTRADRQLTGADFDPESIRRVADGTYWVGEEFGPSLLHFSASGELLRPPVRLPVPGRLAAYGRGRSLVTSPDAPELAVPAPDGTGGPTPAGPRPAGGRAGEPAEQPRHRRDGAVRRRADPVPKPGRRAGRRPRSAPPGGVRLRPGDRALPACHGGPAPGCCG